jgi:hypothetical protein
MKKRTNNGQNNQNGGKCKKWKLTQKKQILFLLLEILLWEEEKLRFKSHPRSFGDAWSSLAFLE